MPPVLTLACERLKLFQIFPVNIYPAQSQRGKNSRVRDESGGGGLLVAFSGDKPIIEVKRCLTNARKYELENVSLLLKGEYYAQ